MTAEAIEELFLDELEQFSSILAHHYNIAGVRDKAIAWGLKALEHCRKHFDNLEALAWVNHLTDWLNEEPADKERDTKLLDVWRTELRVLALLGRNDARRETLDRMMALCERRGFTSLRSDLMNAGVEESELMLPEHWLID